MSIRIEIPTEHAHFEAWREILIRVSDLEIDVEELEDGVRRDAESLWALAFLDGAPPATGIGRPSSIGGANYAMIRVLPEHRRRGVATRLYEAISDHARRAGRGELWGRILADDAESLAFAERRGFRETGRERDVVLDVTRLAPTAPAAPPGIEIVSLAERPDLVHAVYEVELEVGPDVPPIDEYEPHSFERWHSETLEGPGALPDACLVALEDGEIVGYTALRARGAGSALGENLLTAVHRSWRRRGIATALKRAQIERARAAGVTQIFTTNDETNTAMRGVNARLGYEPLPEIMLVRGPLSAAR